MEESENSFLEKYEDRFKELGQGDTTGKILALLMVGNNPYLTLDELAEKVGRSKSTIHGALNRLQQLQLVDYEIADTEPSEGRYPHLYKFNNEILKLQLTRMDTITSFKELLGDAIKILQDRDFRDDRLSDLKETYALYAWFEDKFPEFMESWDELRESGEYRRYLNELDK